MNFRLLPLLLTAGLLASCNESPATPPVRQSLTPGANTVNLGHQTSTTVVLPVDTWEASDLPAWLTVRFLNQSGHSYAVLTAAPLGALDSAAQQSSVSAAITLKNRSGVSYDVTVTLEFAPLTGQVRAATSAVKAQSVTTALSADAIPSEPGRVIVQYRPGLSAQQLAHPLAALSGVTRVSQALGENGSFSEVLYVPDQAAALRALKADPAVLTVIRDVKMQAHALEGDPLAAQQWQLPMLGYEQVAADHPERYARPVTVAVVDSGVQPGHPDLSGRLALTGGADFVAATSNGDGDGIDHDPTDPGQPGSASHGTAVAGIIAASTGNGIGIAGGGLGAPVTVLPVRVLDQSLSGTVSEIMLGLRYAAGETITYSGQTFTNPFPASVINLSVGTSGKLLTQDEINFICDAVKAATARGALVVTSAGNSGITEAQYPSACADSVAVASVTLSAQRQWTHAPYSTSGPQVDVSAPGGVLSTFFNGTASASGPNPDGILTTQGGGYSFVQGTSFAAPAVSALAALVQAKGLTITPAQTRERLLKSATPLSGSSSEQTGVGVINAASALGLSQSGTPVGSGPGLVELIPAGSSQTFKPPVVGDGSWKAWLPNGSYQLRSGPDTNGNGLLDPAEVTTNQKVTVYIGDTP